MKTTGTRMSGHPVVSREERREARKAHLGKEKEFMRQPGELSRRRRELPWFKVEEAVRYRPGLLGRREAMGPGLSLYRCGEPRRQPLQMRLKPDTTQVPAQHSASPAHTRPGTLQHRKPLQPPPGQTFPHAPQLFGSVTKSRHAPAQQLSVPPHAMPQSPQLSLSVWVFTHVTSQQLLPAGQQVPRQQRPLGQHVPVQPLGVQVVLQLPWPGGQQTPAPHS
jgi:hypothetical protein